MELMSASRQWATRPADETFPSLAAMHEAALGYKNAARKSVVATEKLRTVAENGAVKLAAADRTIDLTNWSFGQLSTMAGAPSGYLQTLPAELASECVNTGLRKADETNRDNALLFKVEKGMTTLRALTSTRYSRIWNVDVVERLRALEDKGPWQPAPAAAGGSRGLYLGDRDMFAFMVDNDRRVFETLPGGGLGRGFFISNSEVGAASFKITTYLYQMICANHIVWGAQDVAVLSLRHIGDIDGRAWDNFELSIKKYMDSSVADEEAKVKTLTTKVLGKDLPEILDTVMGLRVAGLTKKTIEAGFKVATEFEERYGDPRTAWGLTSGITQFARDLPNASDRVDIETGAGKLMSLIAA